MSLGKGNEQIISNNVKVMVDGCIIILKTISSNIAATQCKSVSDATPFKKLWISMGDFNIISMM